MHRLHHHVRPARAPRLVTFFAAVLGGAFALAGCGSDASDSKTSDFNDADVTFAQQMIPHHEQAVEMAELAADNASSPRVKALAARIEAAQDPEIETMQGWLDDWGTTDDDSMGHDGNGEGDTDGDMDSHMGSDMPGMMDDKDMRTLRGANGAAFDKMFLAMMVRHHEGAVTMAKTEQAEGKNAEAKALAKKIIAHQTAEIAEMNALLRS